MATPYPIRKAHQEHSVPWFWPLAAAIELGEEGMRLFQRNLAFLVEASAINAPPMPEWATPNRIDLEFDTLRLRNFSRHGSATMSAPVLIDPPYAGHSSSIADYAKGQSLVETLRAAGHDRVFVMDWKGNLRDEGLRHRQIPGRDQRRRRRPANAGASRPMPATVRSSEWRTRCR